MSKISINQRRKKQFSGKICNYAEAFGRPFYEAIDIWDENSSDLPDNYEELLSKLKLLKSISSLTSGMKELRSEIKKYLQRGLEIKTFAEKILQKINYDEQILETLTKLLDHAAKTEDKDILNFIFSDHFFGRYFKINKSLMILLKEFYLPKIKEEKSGLLSLDYKETYEPVIKFVKSIYLVIPLFFKNKDELDRYIYNLNSQDLEKFINRIKNYFSAVISYDYFYYMAFFTNVREEKMGEDGEKGAEFILDARDYFKEIITVDWLDKLEENLIEINVGIELIKEIEEEMKEEENGEIRKALRKTVERIKGKGVDKLKENRKFVLKEKKK